MSRVLADESHCYFIVCTYSMDDIFDLRLKVEKKLRCILEILIYESRMNQWQCGKGIDLHDFGFELLNSCVEFLHLDFHHCSTFHVPQIIAFDRVYGTRITLNGRDVQIAYDLQSYIQRNNSARCINIDLHDCTSSVHGFNVIHS